MVPVCSITSSSVIGGDEALSPRSFSATTTCAELDIGSSSASPWMIPRTRILSSDIGYDLRSITPIPRNARMHTRAWSLVALVSAGLGALAARPLAAAGPQFPPWGATLDYVDPGVSPGEDFFRYGNGGWLKTATIPPDRQVAGVNLELDKGNEAKLKDIITSLLAKPDDALTAEERKLRDLYKAFEDTAAIDAAGITPIKAELDRIASLQ